MPIFRAYCLNAESHIFAGEDVEAIDISAAIDLARSICGGHPDGSEDHVEVWMGRELLFPVVS